MCWKRPTDPAQPDRTFYKAQHARLYISDPRERLGDDELVVGAPNGETYQLPVNSGSYYLEPDGSIVVP